MIEKPMVSVITLMYNSGPFVIKALESLQAQTYFHQVENIIIDDGSKDDSVELLRGWIKDNNHPCIFSPNPKNMGIPKSINKALGLASGKYYTLLSDDIWKPTYLEEQLTRIEKSNDNVALIFSDVEEIDQDGKLISASFLKRRGVDIDNIKKSGYVYDSIIQRSFIPAISAVIKRSVLDRVGLYDERLVSEDYDMWLRITKDFEVIYNPEILIQYRRHPNAFTVSGKFSTAKTKLMIYQKHWGGSKERDRIILENVSYCVVPCYMREDKQLALEWSERIIKNTKPSLGFRLLYSLQKIHFPIFVIDYFYRFLIKFKLMH